MVDQVETTESTFVHFWFSSDGRILVVESQEILERSMRITVRDTRHRKTLCSIGPFGSEGGRFTVSSSGKLFAFTHSEATTIRDSQSGREVQRLDKNESPLCFDPTETRILTFGAGRLRTWDVASRDLISELPLGSCRHAEISSDGEKLIVSERDEESVRDLRTGEELFRLPQRTGAGFRALSWSFAADGKQIVFPYLVGEPPSLVVRHLPLDTLAAAHETKPRELTFEERDRFGVLRAIDHDAKLLLDGLFAEHVLLDDVLDALEADTGLSSPVRRLAVQLARQRGDPWNKDAADAAEETARAADRTAEEYQRALRRVEAASRTFGGYETLVGMLHYRTGAFDRALATLRRRVQQPDGKRDHEALAYLAMVHHRLGQPRQAAPALRRARNLHRSRSTSEDAHIREASALIEGADKR